MPDLSSKPVHDQTAKSTITLTLDELEALIEKKTQEFHAANPSQFHGLAESLKDIAKATQSQATEIARTVRKENATPPKISVFNPDGDALKPKDPLKRETYYVGMRMREDSLTRQEIDLFNQFEGSKTARKGMWKAVVSQNGSGDRLDVTVPAFRTDDRMELPSLVLILSELLYGEDVVDPTKSLQRLTDMEKKIAELTAALEAKSKAA